MANSFIAPGVVMTRLEKKKLVRGFPLYVTKRNRNWFSQRQIELRSLLPTMQRMSNDDRPVAWDNIHNPPKLFLPACGPLGYTVEDCSLPTEFPEQPIVLFATKGPTNVDQN